MILCLDAGNSHIYGGVFQDDQLLLRFRHNSKSGSTSDEIGVFLRSVLRENNIDPTLIKKIAICTVVPEIVYSLTNACRKYFALEPFFLQAGTKTGLKIKYHNPLEVGSDRIANAIAATHLYPNKDLVIIDFGTATTFCAVTKDKDYLGGIIIAGLKISMEALESKTSRLPSVEITRPNTVIGRSTVESIQSGLYYGTIGTVKELTHRIQMESFSGRQPFLIGTGGFTQLFKTEKLFDALEGELVLKGLFIALKMNQ